MQLVEYREPRRLFLLMGALMTARPLSAIAQNFTTRSIVAWMDRHDWAAAVDSLEKHADLILEVSPAWFMPTPDGGVEARPDISVNDARVISVARKKKILLRPLLLNVTGEGTNPGLVLPLLQDARLRERHIEHITALVINNQYDGIDLDYEGLRGDGLELLAQFVEELSVVLKSARKTLAVSLEVQLYDRRVQAAWTRIGDAADSVRIMAYGPKRPTPGPLVDLPWIHSHLQRAAQAISPHKLVHGIPLYGLSWGPRGVTSGTWKQYMGSTPPDGHAFQRDPSTLTLHFKTPEAEVWVEDAESLRRKMYVGHDMGIRRFALWRLGGEDPKVWEIIRAFWK